MPRPDPPIINPLLGKAFIDSLFAEFKKKPQTLEQELKNMNEIIAVEETYLDNPDPDLEHNDFEENGEDDIFRLKEEKDRGGIRQVELDYEGK